MPAAVAAVEAARGGPQQYTEINAFDQGVNLFVATGDGNELPYVYRDGTGLEAPAGPAAGHRDAVRHHRRAPSTPAPGCRADVVGRLPGARPVAVALVQRPTDGLVWDVSRDRRQGLGRSTCCTPRRARCSASVVASQ